MARIVCLSAGAYADIREIARFISQRVSPLSASRWQTRIASAIDRLATEADQWPEAVEAAALGIDLREMLHGRRPHVYRALFTIGGNTVTVQRVRHAAQNQLTEDDV
jgi:plasmid stabilization system protein ParE